MQWLAHVVHIQAEHTGGQLRALLAFVGFARGCLFEHLRRNAAGTTTTPSSSAMTTSPGFTSAPAQTTGMFTDPSVALTVPLEEIALLHTGKFICASTRTSRTPASMMSPCAPRALKLVASRSPKKPSVESAVTAATTMSPGWICSAATCSIQLSPGWSRTVTTVPLPVRRYRSDAYRASSVQYVPLPRVLSQSREH